MSKGTPPPSLKSTEVQAPLDLLAEDDSAPPSYEAAVLDDGRAEIDLNSRLCRTLSVLLPRLEDATKGTLPGWSLNDDTKSDLNLNLNIVIQVVGSRGDVQPFLALGQELQKYGHRVRLATHDCFQEFVEASGIEFFPIGGDPTDLMAYMVKNPGLVPSMKSLKAGDIQKKRKMIADILVGCWKSCVEPGPRTARPFVAEAIIGNPPSFAHVHCAQALGIPVHLMFTMPWSVTKAFSHPLANIVNKDKFKQGQEMANFMSHIAVEWMTWQGLGDLVNEWRTTLGLEPVPFSEGPLLSETLKIPCTYCWSPALVPKPADWGDHIDVCGFFFRNPSPYSPAHNLDEFLRAGKPPIYIGFGSIVIEDPRRLTAIILKAVRAVGARAIVSKGWSNLGHNVDAANDVFFLGDCPHEWLFQRVSVVVHHGGAGTTACGLLNGRPTAVVPFFGDQQFWGDMVADAGAGPRPIPQRSLDSENLATAIRTCLTDSALEAAQKLAERMKYEKGVHSAVASFHAKLPLQTMRCNLLPHKPAAWTLKKNTAVKFSKLAAGIVVQQSDLKWSDFKRYDTKDIDINLIRWDPVTAFASSLMATGAGMAGSATKIVVKPIQAMSQASAPSPSRGSLSRNTSSEDVFGRSAALDLPLAQSELQAESGGGNLAKAAMGAASGVGGFFKHFTKGMLNDLPLAVAEGMRNAPRMYGGEVYEPGVVKDWKTGGLVAVKNFSHGIVEGFGGVVTTPLKEGKEHGAAGAAKGVGKGLLNLVTKTTSGTIGLFAFTSQGLYKSVHAMTHGSTRSIVRELRVVESEYEAQVEATEEDVKRVLQAYRNFLSHEN